MSSFGQTDAKGQTLAIRYDALGRMVLRIEPEGISRWRYDDGWIGKLDEVTGPGDYMQILTYDDFGRLKKKTTTPDVLSFDFQYEYDDQSRVEKLTYPSGFSIRNVYNSHGFLAQVQNAASADVIWSARGVDVFGNVTIEDLGNGLSTVRVYDRATGAQRLVSSGRGMLSDIQNSEYQWDKVGNLIARTDHNQGGLVESFSYDDLYRLAESRLNGSINLELAYDPAGNITRKTGVGTYHYQPDRPHAVAQIIGQRAAAYTYDANGNMTGGAGRSLTWTSFNKPQRISVDGSETVFAYGPDRKRLSQTIVEGGIGVGPEVTQITYIDGLYERRANTWTFERVHYIRAAGRTVALYKTSGLGEEKWQYLHHDHLGSIEVVTDEAGALVERLAYDAFGKRRQPLGWADDPADLLLAAVQTVKCGFTGHEHLDHVGLIHMNGRVYDPVIGRFLSADPYVQSPQNTQGLNRYTYAANNPLSYTDPSGYFLSAIAGALSAIAAFVAEYAVYIAVAAVATAGMAGGYASTVAAIAISSIPGAQGIGLLVQGFAAGLVGSEGDLRAAFMGAWGAGAFSGVGTLVAEATREVSAYGAGLLSSVAHGFIGGVSQELLGGSFRDGFLGAASATAMAPAITSWNNPAMRAATAAVVGGTAAEIGGGKFANGAATAGFLFTLRELPSIYEDIVGYGVDPRPGGIAVTKGLVDPPVQGANNIGEQGTHRVDATTGRPINCAFPCLAEGGGLSRALNQVPLVNATAGLHDVMQINLGTGFLRDALNFPGMVPAAAFTLGAFAGQPLQSLSNQQLIYLSVSNSFDRDDNRRNVYGAAAIGVR